MFQALELLRTLVQPLIDADVAAVMRKYAEAYFWPALNNARKNLGRETIRKILAISLGSRLAYHDLAFK